MVFHFLAWTPLVFFFFTTFRGYVEANWPIGAYPLIFALAASQLPRNLTAIRMTLGLWGTLMAVLAAVVIVQPDWSKKLKFREFHQFDGIVERSVEFEPVYARSYQMAAKMHFELKRPVYKLRGMNRRDFYDYLEGSKPKDKIYYLAVEKGDALPAQYRADGHTVMDTIAVDDRFEIWKVTQP